MFEEFSTEMVSEHRARYGDESSHKPIEETPLFAAFEECSDWVWATVSSWKPFDKDTLGKQWARAIDSVGANLVEGDGRYSYADALHFFIIARASSREAELWLNRAIKRGLVE